MQNEKDFAPLEFLASSQEAAIKSPRRSPRFKADVDTSSNPLRKRMSLPFSEMRVRERRDTGNPLRDRVVSVDQTQLQGRIRRNSIIWPAKANPQHEFDFKLSETLHHWKLRKDQINAHVSIERAIEDSLALIEKSYREGILQFIDPSKPTEMGITYSLLSLLEAIYKCPIAQAALQENDRIRTHFCSVNFIIRDYKSIVEEASLLLSLIKKYSDSIDIILNYLSKKQTEAIEEFAFVPFVRGILTTNSVQEIFKSGILKERDISPFYQRLGMRKFHGLDVEVAKIKIIDMIAHPETLQMVYGPLALPMKSVISKEALSPLKKIATNLSQLETNLEMFSNEEFELKINLTINPMGKIKEKMQMFVEELTHRGIMDFPHAEQAHYQEMLHACFPPLQVGKRRNWLKAFEMVHDLSVKIKQL